MKKCLHCNSVITNNNKFCNRSCAASFNNKGVKRHGQSPNKCLMCDDLTKSKTLKFCSNKCYNIHRTQKIKLKIIDNKTVTWRQIRKHLLETVGHCQECGIPSIWNDKPLILECDHIDGDRSNNILTNAKLLCPNCHSQTETFRAKNTKNPKGKEIRALRYKNGAHDRI